MREKLIVWLAQNYPESLPRRTVEMRDKLKPVKEEEASSMEVTIGTEMAIKSQVEAPVSNKEQQFALQEQLAVQAQLMSDAKE